MFLFLELLMFWCNAKYVSNYKLLINILYICIYIDSYLFVDKKYIMVLLEYY